MNEEQDQKTTEIRDTSAQQGNTKIRRQSVSTSTKVDTSIVIRRVIYYLAGVIIALLAFRIVLLLLAANQGSAFVDFVYVLSGLFATPFYGMFNYQPSYGQSVLEMSSIVAIVVYGLAAVGIAKLFTLTKSDPTA
jgi:hypothetical protein